jgi:hypothetical protein
VKIMMTAIAVATAAADLADQLNHPLQMPSAASQLESVKDHSLSNDVTWTLCFDRIASGRYVVEEPREDVSDPAYWIDKV